MSSQFDVFPHPVPAMRRRYPFVIVLQHGAVADSSSVVIAPLVPPLSKAPSRAYPLLDLNGTSVMLLTPDLAVIQRRYLEGPIVNLGDQRDPIIAAIDMLFVGS